MTGLERLYRYAEENRVLVGTERLQFAPAITIQDKDELDGEYYYVVYDPRQIQRASEEREMLLHELSHIAVGAFYTNRHDTRARRKIENRALRWQIEQLIPKDQLEKAVARGYTEPWELAELFDVSQELMEKAMFYYQNGYLTVDT